MRILYPYKNALWALRPAKPLDVLSRHPCRNPKPLPRGEGLCMLGWLCIVQSLLAYTPGIRAGAILLGLPPLDQAWMLAVRHTKPLHDAVTQMADDLYGGYAPATPFSENTKVYRQTERTGFPRPCSRLNFQPHFFILRQTKHICQLYYIQREKLRGNDL